MGEGKIGGEKFSALLDIRVVGDITYAGVNELDNIPLYNFLGLLGLKYTTGIIILAMILSFATEYLATDSSISFSIMILNAIVIGVMVLVLAFVMYVVYSLYIGKQFQFMPLAISALIAFFLASLAAGSRTALMDSSEMHILVFLALIASLVGSVVFSAFVKVVQRFISA